MVKKQNREDSIIKAFENAYDDRITGNKSSKAIDEFIDQYTKFCSESNLTAIRHLNTKLEKVERGIVHDHGFLFKYYQGYEPWLDIRNFSKKFDNAKNNKGLWKENDNAKNLIKGKKNQIQNFCHDVAERVMEKVKGVSSEDKKLLEGMIFDQLNDNPDMKRIRDNFYKENSEGELTAKAPKLTKTLIDDLAKEINESSLIKNIKKMGNKVNNLESRLNYDENAKHEFREIIQHLVDKILGTDLNKELDKIKEKISKAHKDLGDKSQGAVQKYDNAIKNRTSQRL